MAQSKHWRWQSSSRHIWFYRKCHGSNFIIGQRHLHLQPPSAPPHHKHTIQSSRNVKKPRDRCSRDKDGRTIHAQDQEDIAGIGTTAWSDPRKAGALVTAGAPG